MAFSKISVTKDSGFAAYNLIKSPGFIPGPG